MFTLWRILRLEALYLALTPPPYRRRQLRLTWLNRLAVVAVVASGLLLLATGDLRGLYVLPMGLLLCFAAAGMSAWILLIEINR